MKTAMQSGGEVRFSVTPYLVIKDVAKAMEFYRKAFDAQGLMHIRDSAGRTIHAEIQIGDTPIILTDEQPEMLILSPESLGGTPVALHIYVPHADEFFEQAIRSGAHSVSPMKNQFMGDRCGSLRDPFGHLWHIANQAKDPESDDLHRRVEALLCATAESGWR